MRRPGWRLLVGLGWVLALALHWAHSSWVRTPSNPAPEGLRLEGRPGNPDVAFTESRGDGRPSLLLIHGSPGSSSDFDSLIGHLPDSLGVIAVDLPGFGNSTRRLADYSFTRHAGDLLALADSLALDRVHVLAVSMGGGVALELVGRDPDRIASLTLVSSIGFQEYELTGDYWTNHALHLAQVGLVWVIDHLVPHFGLLDSGGLAWSYARNFSDSDQRELLDPLLRWCGPTLILHGSEDFLVPVEAARAGAEAMPQARLSILEGAGHFILWTRPQWIAEQVASLVAESGGSGGTLSAIPRTPPAVTPLSGPGLWLLLGLAFAGAVVFAPAANWWFAPFVNRGLVQLPILMVPLAAGSAVGGLRRGGGWASAWRAALAACAHAVVLVLLGRSLELRSATGLALGAVTWALGALVLRIRSHPSRRRLRGLWLRWTRWEYWPSWLVYGPVVPRLIWRSRHHGGPRSVTAVNPDMELGGLVAESKSAILGELDGASEVATWCLVDVGDLATRRRAVEDFARRLESPWPIVLKPDRGERGLGVTIARSGTERDAALERIRIPLIAQEFVDGPEYGIFWYRWPGADAGRIWSVAAKEPVVVHGDGRRRLVDLLLDHDRVLPLLGLHLERHAGRLGEVIPEGEVVQLTELGTHCLGATFVDAGHLATPELGAAIDRIMARAPGLDFGRFDIRVPSRDALREGRCIKVIEFNGLSAESASMYDPGRNLAGAWATLSDQWTLALRIGDARRSQGAAIATWTEILRAWWLHRSDRELRGG